MTKQKLQRKLRSKSPKRKPGRFPFQPALEDVTLDRIPAGFALQTVMCFTVHTDNWAGLQHLQQKPSTHLPAACYTMGAEPEHTFCVIDLNLMNNKLFTI